MSSIRTIKSNATARSRSRAGKLPVVVGDAPVMTVAPAITSGFWTELSGIPSVTVYKTAPGMTLVGTLGTWDETEGVTTLSGRFYEVTGPTGTTRTPISDPGVTELEVPEGSLDKQVSFVVTATRDGISVERQTRFFSVTNVTNVLAVWSNGAFPAFNGYYPGQAIPKPAYTWTVQPAFGSYTTEGEWYKNGLATGNSDATYTDTEEGDVVSWYEELVNEFDVTASAPVALKSANPADSVYWLKFLVNRNMAAYQQESIQAVDDRIDGLAGGAANMNLFTTKDHPDADYVINDDCWARDLFWQIGSRMVGHCSYRPDGTWGEVGRGGWISLYGGTMITPRHFLTSGHTQFSWNSDGSAQGFTARWVLENGNIVDAEIIGGSRWGTGYDRGLSVGLIDRDIQAEGVHIIPLANIQSLKTAYPSHYINPSTLRVSQAASDQFIEGDTAGMDRAWNGLGVPQPISDYPRRHDTMAYAQRENFEYSVWGGDSGTPIFACVNDTLFLDSILSGDYCRTDANVALINTLIAECDAAAVTRGDIAAPTGYTVTRCANFADPTLLYLSAEDPVCIFVSEGDPTPLFALPN